MLKMQYLGGWPVHSANILRGKNKPNYTPNQDCGDNLVIINAIMFILLVRNLQIKFTTDILVIQEV
jgi:large subunit ribosomal protein L13